MLSIYLIFGLLMFFGGSFFGIYSWIISSITNIEASTGTVMLAAMPIIVGIQFLLQAVQIDMNSIPRKNK